MSSRSPHAHAREPQGLRWNAWNLLLLVPLLMLVTPLFNSDEPRLAGLPLFYWAQFLFIPIGVLCVGLVYLKTKDEPVSTGKPDELSVDDLDRTDLDGRDAP